MIENLKLNKIWSIDDDSQNFLHYYPQIINETNNNIFFNILSTPLFKQYLTTTTTSKTITSDSLNASSTNITQSCFIKSNYFFEEQIIYLYIICPLAIIGIILNILSIKVFNDKSFNTVAFCYLRLMTWFDLVICGIVVVYCLKRRQLCK